MSEPEKEAPPTGRYRYYTGQTVLPGNGQAIPLCWVGPKGCHVTGSDQIWVGGPDVTPQNGFPVDKSTPATIDSTEIPPPTVVGVPPEPMPVLYACASKSGVTVSWLSGQPGVLPFHTTEYRAAVASLLGWEPADDHSPADFKKGSSRWLVKSLSDSVTAGSASGTTRRRSRKTRPARTARSPRRSRAGGTRCKRK